MSGTQMSISSDSGDARLMNETPPWSLGCQASRSSVQDRRNQTLRRIIPFAILTSSILKNRTSKRTSVPASLPEYSPINPSRVKLLDRVDLCGWFFWYPLSTAASMAVAYSV
eukprot:2739292-Prymnesium_polylepis.1